MDGLEYARRYLSHNEHTRTEAFEDMIVSPDLIPWYLNRIRLDLQKDCEPIPKRNLLWLYLFTLTDCQAVLQFEIMMMDFSILTVVSISFGCQRVICGPHDEDSVLDVMTGIQCIV